MQPVALYKTITNIFGRLAHHAERAANCDANARKLLHRASLELECDGDHGCEDGDSGLHAGGNYHARHVDAQDVQ